MSISSQERRVFLEAFGFLCAARLAVLLLPFKTLAGKMGDHMVETPLIGHQPDNKAIQDVSRSIKKASLYTPCRSLCMEQALAASIMLKSRNLPATIYFGFQKDKQYGKNIKAHAWIRSGETILTGGSGHRQFAVVAYFGR